MKTVCFQTLWRQLWDPALFGVGKEKITKKLIDASVGRGPWGVRYNRCKEIWSKEIKNVSWYKQQKIFVTLPDILISVRRINLRYNISCFMKYNKGTVKLGYNEHGYNEYTAITNKSYCYFWSQMATLLHKSSRL